MRHLFKSYKTILAFIVILISSINVFAEDNDRIWVGINVVDKVTNRRVKCQLILYTAQDTTIIYPCGGSSEDSRYQNEFGVPSDAKIGSKYLIRIDNYDIKPYYDDSFRRELERQGKYEPKWVEFTIPENHNGFLELPTVYMTRPNAKKPIELKEMVVKASKVMFYHKGDTLIYNADAFLLAEGSMLDALIAQLPGVELKNNGQIFCNGKLVDNLLLNGRDLFNGNKELMLENLAAYTVKDIAVYDKLGRDSKLAGYDIGGDKKHVMDVRLKREYANGWIVNAEGGYGTKNTYLARLFAMWYSDNASISAFAGANNLNSRNEPGQNDGSWSPEQMETGITRRLQGGVIYTVKGPDDLWDLSGSLKYENKKTNSITNTTTQNFYDSGDTYQYGWRNSLDRNWRIETNQNYLFTIKKKANLQILPSFSYSDRSFSEASTDALFSRGIRDISEQMVKNIYGEGDTLAQHFVNRNIRDELNSGTNLNGRFYAKAFMLMPAIGGRKQTLKLEGEANYTKREEDRFNRYQIDYADASMPEMKASQYFKSHPDWDKAASLISTYTSNFDKSEHLKYIDFEYMYSYNEQRRTSLLYLLDKVNNFDSFNSSIGTLPSMRDYTSFADANQSYITNFTQHVNELNPTFYKTPAYSKNELRITIRVPIKLYSRKFDYIQPELNKVQHINRSNLTANFYGGIMYEDFTSQKKLKYRKDLQFDIWFDTLLPDLFDIIDHDNTTDPLNIFKGNPNLRNAYSLSTGGRIKFYKKSKFTQYISVRYKTIFDQFARGYMYNKDSGVRTYSTYNVDGNWRINGSYEIFLRFGKYNTFNLTSTTSPSYQQSVDLVGVDGETVGNMPAKRKVGTTSVNEEIKLNWQTGRNKLSAHISGRFNHYNSADKGFYNFNSWIWNYGISELANLPQNWSLSTDLTLYTRRGFADSRLNSTDLVWNARVTKSILKGSVVFALDAYDLLHQLSNITYVVNAQARTETVSNVIPAYLLFHIQWRFNKQPKKW